MVGSGRRKVDSDQIMRGTYDHRKVDRTDGAPDADSYQAVNIRHEEWGVSGKLDAAKMTDSGIVIREYKATPVKRAMIVTPAMRTQLALQAACLENMGFHVAGTEIFSPRTIGGLKLTLTKKIMKTRIKRWKKLER